MQIAHIYSPNNGYELFSKKENYIFNEITAAIRDIDPEVHRTKMSREKRTFGKPLLSPISINKSIKASLSNSGWASFRETQYTTDCPVLLEAIAELSPEDQRNCILESGKEPILTSNEVDFVKDKVALEVQFGKYPFVSYDLHAKHAAYHIEGRFDITVEILPTKNMQKQMSSGIAYYEAEIKNMVRLGSSRPSYPFILIGIEP